MIASIYARKSTDQNISDEAKSVTRQVEHARAYAAKKGLHDADAVVHVAPGAPSHNMKLLHGIKKWRGGD